MRAFLVLLFTFSVFLWVDFAGMHFPWIVLADSNFSLARERERDAALGAWLASRCFFSIRLILLAAWLGIAGWHFPAAALTETPIDLIVYVADFAALCTLTMMAGKDAR